MTTDGDEQALPSVSIRTAISDRIATFVKAATAKSLGCNQNEITVSRSFVRRARI